MRYSATEYRMILKTGLFKSFRMALFNRPYTTFYWFALVNIALFCTVFELFAVE